jgi:3-isopropylmalate dehydrogenase
MALRYSFDRDADADLLEQAIEKVLADGVRTADLMQAQEGSPVTTSQMGDAILGALNALN